MKKYIIIFIGLITSWSLSGQVLEDALRYSMTSPGGTARTIGAGGAFGALGGDFGAIATNPAGLAVFRKSELVISPGFLTSEANSILSGSSSSRAISENYFSLENIGLVINKNPVGSNWQTSNIAIGYNKIANFNQDIAFSGSSIGTITERWAEFADGFTPDELYDFEESLAYDAQAIFDVGDNVYGTDFDLNRDLFVEKNQLIQRRGGVNEISLSWAGNYNNKFNFGIGLGVPFLSFREEKTYREEDPRDEVEFFNELEFYEFTNTTGTGLNFKGGIIYTPVRSLRLGVSLHSPTWYALTDDWFTELTYDFSDNQGNQRSTVGSPDGNFQYRLATPWKAILSVGSLFKAGEIQGFVSGDVEYRDYSSSRFNLTATSDNVIDRENQDFVNGEISEFLASTILIRLGTELAINRLRLRGGIQLDQSPFVSDEGAFDNTISLGAGFRSNRFFIDFAYTIINTGEAFYPYITSDISRDPFVNSDISRNNMVFTVGFKF